MIVPCAAAAVLLVGSAVLAALCYRRQSAQKRHDDEAAEAKKRADHVRAMLRQVPQTTTEARDSQMAAQRSGEALRVGEAEAGLGLGSVELRVDGGGGRRTGADEQPALADGMGGGAGGVLA